MPRKNRGRFHAEKQRRENPFGERSECRTSGAGESPMSLTSAANGRQAKRFNMHWVIGTGWIHTHGMEERGYPEVEVRGVPDFLAESVAGLIRHVCDYMLDEAVSIKPGETMQTSPRTRFQLIKPEPLPGEEDHYTVERLQIVDVEHICEHCGQCE
jgi:Domain of unknown function (DUF4261)